MLQINKGYYLTAIMDGEETLINVADLNELMEIYEAFSKEGIRMVACYDKEENEDVSDWVTE